MSRPGLKKSPRIEAWIMLIVAVALLLLGAYTGFLGWMAYQEPTMFQTAARLPASGAVLGQFYKIDGDGSGAFLTPATYPEIQGALQYQVSRETKDDSGDGWTQTAVIAAERIEAMHLGTTLVVVSHATRVLGDTQQVIRPVSDRERLKLDWTPGASQHFVAYGVFDGKGLGDGRFQRVYLTSAAAEKELLDLMGQSGWIKATVLATVGLIALLMGVFAIRSALKPVARARPSLTEPAPAS